MTLYGYFRNPCIHESAGALMSLHQTKVGAYRAMRAAIWLAAVEERETFLRDGYRSNTMSWRAFYILPIEVFP